MFRSIPRTEAPLSVPGDRSKKTHKPDALQVGKTIFEEDGEELNKVVLLFGCVDTFHGAPPVR